MQRRWWLAIGLAVVVLAAVGVFVAGAMEARRPIVVGILHSRSGPLAESERAMVEAEVLALEEINAAGGLLGRPLRWEIADGRSQPSSFAEQARALIAAQKASVVFGGGASHCRKAVKAVVEENNHLLIDPMSSEGLEQSPNIVYAGGTANQQVLPAVGWCADVLKARKFFVIGTDSVWGRVLGALALDQIKGLGAKSVGEAYLALGSADAAVTAAVAKIKAAGPDVILSSLEGPANGPFYAALSQGGVTPDRTPVVSFSLTEDDLARLPSKDVAGQYAARHYVQSIDRPENSAFVSKLRAKSDAGRTASDEATAAYNSVRLWAQAVIEAGTDNVADVRRAIRRQSLDAPEGVVSIESENLYGWRPFVVGKARADGQFDVVFALPKPIYPVPFPPTRPRAEWDTLLRELSSGWGGQWANTGAGVANH